MEEINLICVPFSSSAVYIYFRLLIRIKNASGVFTILIMKSISVLNLKMLEFCHQQVILHNHGHSTHTACNTSIVIYINMEAIYLKHNSLQLSTTLIPLHTLSTPIQLNCFDSLLLLDLLQVWQYQKFKLIQLKFHFEIFFHAEISILHILWTNHIYTTSSDVHAQNTFTSQVFNVS